MRHLDLFSGIGGFSIASDAVWENVEHIFCDNEPFAQAVLQKHWPNSKIYGDIRQLSKDALVADTYGQESGRVSNLSRKKSTEDWNGDFTVDLLTGGFPCQPFSHAGKRKGEEDDRFLWPDMFRLIGELKPRWIVAENVRGLLTQKGGVVFKRICTDLESEGYEVQPIVIPACAVNAPHRRDRVWIIAHRNGGRMEGQRAKLQTAGTSGKDKDATNTSSKRLERKGEFKSPLTTDSQYGGRKVWDENWFEAAARLCPMDDGLSKRLVRLPDGTKITAAKWRKEALHGAGNAIVPQVAIEIFKAIKSVDQ